MSSSSHADVAISLLSYGQRDEVTQAVADFTCRGPRHEDDPTVEDGDSYIRDAVWANLDEAGITRTWVAVVDGEIGGYIALAADAVLLTKGERKQAELEGAHFNRYGCIQIVMVAVRADFQAREDMKVGRALVEHAELVGLKAGTEIGARFLAADVNPPAQGFYERCGFTSLASEAEEMEKKRAKGVVPMVLDLQPRA